MTSAQHPRKSSYVVPMSESHHGLGAIAIGAALLAVPLAGGSGTAALGFLAGLTAVVFGLVGAAHAARGTATRGGMALVGALAGAVALVLSLAGGR